MLDDPVGFLKRAGVLFIIVVVILVLVGAGSLAKEMLNWVGDAVGNIVDFASSF